MEDYEKLLKEFYKAAIFLKKRVEEDGWYWSSNFLREYVRCTSGMKFSNSVSPTMLRALRHIHPELEPYIEIAKLTKGEIP